MSGFAEGEVTSATSTNTFLFSSILLDLKLFTLGDELIPCPPVPIPDEVHLPPPDGDVVKDDGPAFHAGGDGPVALLAPAQVHPIDAGVGQPLRLGAGIVIGRPPRVQPDPVVGPRAVILEGDGDGTARRVRARIGHDLHALAVDLVALDGVVVIGVDVSVVVFIEVVVAAVAFVVVVVVLVVILSC